MTTEAARTAGPVLAPHSAVAVTGLGIRLPGFSAPAELADASRPRGRRRFSDPGPESDHALAAVTDATACSVPPAEGRTATVWATSTAGLADYGRTCADIPVAGPARVSPRRTARSAFTAPVTAVSVRFGFDGPYLNLTGERNAGADAVVEAVRMLQQGQCARVVVGGSAGVSTWRPGPPEDLAEGALCAVLRRDAAADPRATVVRPLARARTGGGPGPFVRACLEQLEGLPDHLVLSAPVRDTTAADMVSRLCPAPCIRVEERTGDLGAAGGLAALVTAAGLAAAHSHEEQRTTRVLALALGVGAAVAVEVTSGRRSPQ